MGTPANNAAPDATPDAAPDAGTVSTFNFGSTSAIRQSLPLAGTPPMVQVFVYDPALADAYSITLSYHGTYGVAETATQYVASMGINTLAVFLVDAASIDGVQASPLKLTGAVYKQ